MDAYHTYKDSGIIWVGQTPQHWSEQKIKFLFKEKKSTPNLSLNCGSISFGRVVFKDDDSIPSSRKETYQEVLDGEFLINPLNLNYDLKSLRIARSDKNVVVSPGYMILQLQRQSDPKFFEFLLHVFDTEHMKSLGSGVRQTISFNHLKTEQLPIPPIDEQRKIGQFLDRKTTLIDSLIEKTVRKIELFKEKRTSLINEVVTKGLNPDVEMKDSGVEWIGEIPSHWGVSKLKYSSQVLPSNVDKHIFPDEIQVRLCNYTDVYYNEKIDDSLQLKEGSCTESEFKKFLLMKGDVIVTKDSESPDDIGIPTLVNSDFEDVVCGYHLTLFRPYRVHGGYLFRFIQSTGTRRYFEVNSNGITRFSLGKSTLEDLIHPTPPQQEQELIVEYLDEQTSIIDSTITTEEKRIELLKEYRQSLISEVVTGKVKVTRDE